MAYIYRLIILCLISFFPFIAKADFPAPSFEYRVEGTDIWYSDPMAMCQAYASSVSTEASQYVVTPGWNFNNDCKLSRPGQTSVNINRYAYKRSVCPANSIISPSNSNQCRCNAGMNEDAGAQMCIDPNASPPVNHQAVCNDAQIGFAAGNGGQNNSAVYSGNIDDGITVCFKPYPSEYPTVGCTKHFEKDLAWQNDNGSWSTRGRWHMSTIGSTSNAIPCAVESNTPEATPENPLANPAPTPCSNGYQGSVNGVSTCIPNVGKNGVDFSPSKTTEEDANKIVETTEEYRCEGGKCTTTTTTVTTDKSTNATTTETKTKEQTDKDFCKDPKNSEKCNQDGSPKYGGNGSGDDDDDGGKSFGGSCSAGFQCSGDALQCAMAREQHKRNCALFEDRAGISEIGDYEAAKSSAGDGAIGGGGGSVNVSDMGGGADEFLGAASCPPDRTINGPGWEVSIPYSKLCPYLEYFGYIFMAVCGLVAVRIFISGVK